MAARPQGQPFVQVASAQEALVAVNETARAAQRGETTVCSPGGATA